MKSLQSLQLDVVLLTGDNEATAHAIAEQAGISRVMANVLPWDKANAVEQLRGQGKYVLMVGDGINDAPSLKLADVGFAMGSGTDIAKSAGDIVILNNSISCCRT